MIAIDEPQLENRLQHVELRGTRLAYVEQGRGQPLVFVHGSISDLTIWQPILESVGGRYRAIAYSRRYAWPNDPISDTVADGLAQHATDLAEFIETLKLGPVHLVGNSFGGFISLVV